MTADVATAHSDPTTTPTLRYEVPKGRYLATLCLGTLGIVYGDIGTSPLYALRECFSEHYGLSPTHADVLGVLSLVFWALTIVISVKYLGFVLRADNRGEGGILALMALATQASPDRQARGIVFALGLFGAALLYGDGIITPAISVLSAVEGLKVAAPTLESFVIPITIVILVGLFWVQHLGSAGIGAIFGPVTLVWFIVIASLGVYQIAQNPSVLWAVSPHYAVEFLIAGKLRAFLVLGAVFLVVTGGEALYADMGHFGRVPIRLTWFTIVLPALVLNYFGQGALLLRDPSAVENPFFRMAPSWALYPMIALSTLATIIASQAVISGAFSLTRQATMLGLLPRMLIQHTSSQQIGQVYVPAVNWALMLATIGLVLGFETSANLAGAYGIAVTTTMVITTLLAYIVARRMWGWSLFAASAITVILLIPDLAFFGANLVKVADGGWFPLLVALFVFVMMATWRDGRTLLATRILETTVDLDDFYELMHIERPRRVPGTAVFMTGTDRGTPPALMQNFLHNRVLHETNILLTVVTEEAPRLREDERLTVQSLEHGFVRVKARYGFLEDPDIPKLLLSAQIPGYAGTYSTFFLGRETLLGGGHAGMRAWRKRLFAFMARNSQRATDFFRIPADQVIEIGAQINL